MIKNLALISVVLSLPSLSMGSEIVIDVTGFRNQVGELACLLFASPEGFPKESDKAVQKMTTPFQGSAGQCVFKDVKAGHYAVVALHDENKNQQLDTGFLGKPREGYGVSGNNTYALKAPGFEENAFDLKDNEKKTVTVILRNP
jgi:uncharacterized protein (DUF2141 family)